MTPWNKDPDPGLTATVIKLHDVHGQSFTICTQPAYAGGYRIGSGTSGSVIFMITKKPSAWHRFWVKVVLGWVWVDEPKEKK